MDRAAQVCYICNSNSASGRNHVLARGRDPKNCNGSIEQKLCGTLIWWMTARDQEVFLVCEAILTVLLLSSD